MLYIISSRETKVSPTTPSFSLPYLKNPKYFPKYISCSLNYKQKRRERRSRTPNNGFPTKGGSVGAEHLTLVSPQREGASEGTVGSLEKIELLFSKYFIGNQTTKQSQTTL